MKPEHCDKLDDYLGGWLELPERAAFEGHLPGCARCREEIERQRRLDHLLSQAESHLEPVPPELTARIERRLTTAARRLQGMRAVAGLAAAAALVFAVIFWPQPPQRQTTGPVVELPDASDRPALDPPRDSHAQTDTPAQQLARMVVSRCKRNCPSDHRWARAPRFTPVAAAGRRQPPSPMTVADESEAEPPQEPSGPLKVLLSSARQGSTCILAGATLAERAAEEIDFHNQRTQG